MLPASLPALVVALVVTFVAAMIQGVVGMGFALVSVPILALVDPALAPVPQLIATLPLTLAMAWREHRHIHLPAVGWIIAGRAPGAVVGLVLLTFATRQVLDGAIAVIVIGAVAVIASGFHLERTPVSEFGTGMLSGASSLIASIGGPPLALLYTNDDGPTIRSNLAVVFSAGLVITILARSLSGNVSASDVRVAIVIFPALVAGYLTSLRIKDRVPRQTVKIGVLTISFLGAVGLLARVLF